MFMIAIVCIYGYISSKKFSAILRRIRLTAAAITHAERRLAHIDGTVIREIDDISSSLIAAGKEVEELAQDRRRLSAIATHAPVVLYAQEIAQLTRGRSIYVSISAEQAFGWNQEELKHDSWWLDNIHPDDRTVWNSAFSNLHIGVTRHAEYRLRKQNGQYVWVYDSISVQFDPISSRDEGVGVLIDVTARRQAVAQLIEADKMSSLGRVLASVTHELNQPLNFIAVAGFSLRQMLSQATFDRERAITKLDAIIDNINHAAGIIQQMRVFGRKPLIVAQPAPFGDSLDGVLTMATPQFKLDNIAVDTTACKARNELIANPLLLEQVLLNLLINGRDAIAERNKGADQAVSGIIHISAQRHNGNLEITVSDNGTGIPDEVLPSLFEPFFTTKPPKQGTGLGLSISYGIIQDMGGKLTASNTASGAQFTIILPTVEA